MVQETPITYKKKKNNKYLLIKKNLLEKLFILFSLFNSILFDFSVQCPF